MEKMRTTEEPKIANVDSPMHDTVETHPAYGQIGASRVSGAAYLYGSDFSHQHYIKIEIRRSQLHRGLSNDRPFGREELIEVSLSEAQWATFVSSLNCGMGVQCTIDHFNGKTMPGLPSPKDRHQQIKAEADERLAKAMSDLKDLDAAIKDSKLSGKAQKDLCQRIEFIRRNLSDNIQFVADQFEEHIETVTEHAKIEIGAYITQSLARAGLNALTGQSPISLPALTAPPQDALSDP